MRVIYWDWDRRILGVDGLTLVTQTHPGDLVTLVSCGEHRAKSCAACPQVIHFNFFLQFFSIGSLCSFIIEDQPSWVQGHDASWCNGDCFWKSGQCKSGALPEVTSLSYS